MENGSRSKLRIAGSVVFSRGFAVIQRRFVGELAGGDFDDDLAAVASRASCRRPSPRRRAA